jgi:hypothetical protein
MIKLLANKQRDFGAILAVTAAGVAGIAVITGFIIVGGPGHARDERLDQLTSQKIGQVVGVAQCAFDASGVAPIDYQTAAQTRSAPAPGMPPALCDAAGGMQIKVGTGNAPASPGDVTYGETGPTQIKVCANFLAPQSQNDGAQVFLPYSDIYPALAEGHPAGVHCYVLDLVRSGVPFDPAPLPAPGAKSLQ